MTQFVSLILLMLAIALLLVASDEYVKYVRGTNRVYGLAAALALACIAGYYAGVIGGAW